MTEIQRDFTKSLKCHVWPKIIPSEGNTDRYVDIVCNESGETVVGDRNIVSLGVICKVEGTFLWQNDKKSILDGRGYRKFVTCR